MTIKQQGGIFGRNPTFNDANVDNDLTVSGSLGVGTTSPTRTAEIVSSNNVPMRVVSTASISQIRLVASGTTTGATEPSIGAQADGLVLRTNGSTAVTITAAQNIKVNSGNGIDFSATSGTGTSELFDDYEEGTWTPTVTSGSGTLTTVTVSEALYTKIGRFVTVHTKFVLTDAGTGSASLIVDGFPYVINSDYGNGVAMGRSVSGGDLMFGQLSGGNSKATLLRNYDKTDPITNGHTYTLTATYGV